MGELVDRARTEGVELTGDNGLLTALVLKVLYLVATERQKNRTNPTSRVAGWKTILNARTIHYSDRIQAAGD